MKGLSLSHYRIVQELGRGGIGEVYRAEDPNLSHQVAIKVLPGTFLANPEGLMHFDRDELQHWR